MKLLFLTKEKGCILRRHHLCKSSLQSANYLIIADIQLSNDYPHQSTEKKSQVLKCCQDPIPDSCPALQRPCPTTLVRPDSEPIVPVKRCGDRTPSLAPNLLLPPTAIMYKQDRKPGVSFRLLVNVYRGMK